MSYSLLIFDWDGTLADSTGRIIDSMQMAARRCQLPDVSDLDVKRIIGLGLPEALQTLWPKLSQHEMEQVRIQYAQAFVDDCKTPMGLYQGASKMLHTLNQGYTLAVATGKSRKGLNRALEELPERALFSVTRCADETRSKPHPMMLEEILAQTNTPVEKALMIGDTSYDLDMAANIGMDSVGIGHGAHSEEELWACGPLTVCRSISELHIWIEKQ